MKHFKRYVPWREKYQEFLQFDDSSVMPTMSRIQHFRDLTRGFAVAALSLLWRPNSAVRWLSRRHSDVIYFGPSSKDKIAMTIDDAPSSETPGILRALRENHSRATFFVIASQVAGNEGILEEIVAQGHELGNHLYCDRASILLDAAEFESELTRTGEILNNYAAITWFRPGSGWFTKGMLRTAAKLGYTCVLGSVYPLDAQLPTTAFAENLIVRDAKPGSIVIMHDRGKRGQRTATILRKVLPALRSKGYTVGTVSDLFG